MNITELLAFTDDKVSVSAIKKTEGINILSIGLNANQLLAEHKTPVPTTLIVLSGEIEFHIDSNKMHLVPGDVYEIPVGIMHEVLGLAKKNIFLLIQDKS